jgi:hypothetical protein
VNANTCSNCGRPISAHDYRGRFRVLVGNNGRRSLWATICDRSKADDRTKPDVHLVPCVHPECTNLAPSESPRCRLHERLVTRAQRDSLPLFPPAATTAPAPAAAAFTEPRPGESTDLFRATQARLFD